MFKKVLVVEDIDAINVGLTESLRKAFEFEIEQAKYCDKAFLQLTKAQQEGNPFDLLITDLSFKKSHLSERIQSGDQLIGEARRRQPDLMTIIYSIEDRPFRIKEFLAGLNVNGYVLKGRDSTQEMIQAIKKIFDGESYVSPNLLQNVHQSPSLEIDNYDILLLKELSEGFSQNEISQKFGKKGINPSSLSSIEKRINRLKDYFMARNTIHLVALAKDMGLF